jgi:hypothetical protein
MSQQTTQEPRGGHVIIANTPWLARMTDKARLDAAGQIKAYDLKFPCPMDQQCLGRIGLDAKTFQDIAVSQNENESAFIQALESAGAKLG